LLKGQAVTGQHSERGEEPCRDPPGVRTMLQVEWGCVSEPPPSPPPSLTNIQDYHNWQESEKCFCLRLSQKKKRRISLVDLWPPGSVFGTETLPSLSAQVSSHTIRNSFSPRHLSQWGSTYQTAKV
jgi:hypothetical protein